VISLFRHGRRDDVTHCLILFERCTIDMPGGEHLPAPPACFDPLPAINCYWYREPAAHLAVEPAAMAPPVPEPNALAGAAAILFAIGSRGGRAIAGRLLRRAA
jgi:hypothetical protein